MKRILLLLMVLAAAATVMVGQPLTTPVSITPDCLIFFDFTGAGNSAQFDNRFVACDTWKVSYTSTGFAALTLTLQDAPDNAGVPAAWVAFAGTLIDGVNPNVAITQGSTVERGYYPWMRVNLGGLGGGPGRVRGSMYGYRSAGIFVSLLGGIAGTVTANQGTPAVQGNRWPVFLSDGAAAWGPVANPLFTRLSDGAAAQGTQTNPLFSRLSDGTNPVGTTANPLGTGLEYFLGASSTWTPAPACNQRAAITLAGAGTTEIIAASGATAIRLCHLSLSLDGSSNVTVVQGTGVNCAGGPANITGAYRDVLGLALDLGDRSLVTTAASQAMCVTLSAAVNGGGFALYAQY